MEPDMSDPDSAPPTSITKLILVPALITLGITLLRLTGELKGWSPVFFGRAAGGGGSLLGISWLPLILGPYFALKLARSDRGPASVGRAIGLAMAGLVLFFLASYLAFGTTLAIAVRMPAGFLLMIVAGITAWKGWPALGKTLTAYAYAARIPVLIIMFFAFRGNWGTHYDAIPPEYTGPMDLMTKFFGLGAMPQLIFWVVYTIIIGALLGTIFAAVAHRRPPAAPAA
jgi:hypothetical protein